MTIYKYYSIIDWCEEDQTFNVDFPDLENVFTDGDTLHEAITMAQDVLGQTLASNEDDNMPFNPPSPAKDIHIPEGASLVLITVDTDDFRDVEED
ncbi:MAG TPA: type II toxin-antitoxin system HicB family antitoxin [Ureibacillus sp.]|nr:type II toxin-antitoxin system HicB family antitoxin [Ureibacillus sp.]